MDKFKLPIALSVVGIVLIIGGIFTSGIGKAKPNPPAGGFPKESLVTENQKMISVDVSGAVQKPGVYSLNEGSRIEDAVLAAGGITESANTEYISKYLNMAQKLSDGTKIYIPKVGEQGVSPVSAGSVAGASANAVVNINTATQAELETLSGIGPVTASKIISDRPYQTAEDLLNKKVVSKSVFEKIKDSISLY